MHHVHSCIHCVKCILINQVVFQIAQRRWERGSDRRLIRLSTSSQAIPTSTTPSCSMFGTPITSATKGGSGTQDDQGNQPVPEGFQDALVNVLSNPEIANLIYASGKGKAPSI